MLQEETVIQNTTPPKDTLYYDGTCPLCAKEISLLKKLTGKVITFTDIHQLKRIDNKIPSTEVLLRRLHLQCSSGEWLIGLDATVRVWSYTHYGWLFKVLRWPVISIFSDLIYTRWADRRYQKRYECQQCI